METIYFPNLLRNAMEIEVKVGNWGVRLKRTKKLSGGCPIFKTSSCGTWNFLKTLTAWSLAEWKNGKWSYIFIRWDPINLLWVTTVTGSIFTVKVTKLISEENQSYRINKSWREKLMKKIWEQGFAYDIKIRLKDGHEIQAHRAIVTAACPSWKGLIESSGVEGETTVIELLDINPAVVKAFVKALYLGEFEQQTLLPGIALMADRYKARSLMHEVVQAMQSALDTEGPDFYLEVIETLRRLPETNRIKKLKAKLYEMNKGISQEIFYKRLGIN